MYSHCAKRNVVVFLGIVFAVASASKAFAWPPTATPISQFDSSFNFAISGTEQWYSVNLTKGYGISAVLVPHLGASYDDLEMVLFDANGNQVNQVYSVSDGLTGDISHTAASTGLYYIQITASSGATGNYDLAVYRAWFNPNITDASRTFYGTINTAKHLQNGNNALQTRYFRLAAQKGANVTLSAAAHLSAGSLGMALYDRDGKNIVMGSATYDGQTGVINRTLAATGVYYLAVWGISGAAGNYDLTATGILANGDTDGDGLYDAAEYVHRTRPDLRDTDGDGTSDKAEIEQGRSPIASRQYIQSEITPATTRLAALALPYLDAPVNAPCPGTESWFSFHLDQDQSAAVAATAHLNSHDLTLEVYDPDGFKIGSGSFVSNGRTGALDLTAFTTGTHYVRMIGSDQTTGNYDLAVYRGWSNRDVADIYRNFYSTPNTAAYVQTGNHDLSDRPLAGGRTAEYFRFHAQSGADLSFNVTAHLNRGNLIVVLYDDTGFELKRVSNITDGQTGVLSNTMSYTGMYYLAVLGDSDASGNFDLSATGPFDRLTLTAPNGAEFWRLGSQQIIRWTSAGIGGNVRIRISRDGGNTWTTLAGSTPNDGSHPWTAAGQSSSRTRIWIESLSIPGVSDGSNGDFRLSARTAARFWRMY